MRCDSKALNPKHLHGRTPRTHEMTSQSRHRQPTYERQCAPAPAAAAPHFPQFSHPCSRPVMAGAWSWPEPYSTDISTAAPEYPAAEKGQPTGSVTPRVSA
jgi:hypothetical protein